MSRSASAAETHRRQRNTAPLVFSFRERARAFQYRGEPKEHDRALPRCARLTEAFRMPAGLGLRYTVLRPFAGLPRRGTPCPVRQDQARRGPTFEPDFDAPV